MNVDNINRECKVVSKYFTGNTVMDESLTDFKEKKSFQGPKNVKAAPKPRAKKAVKRIKGQKDIRTALKSKKSELIAYSKDFDNVCKKSGIDVDSEQLQLAIALSKSLQTSESADNPTTSKPLSAQQRTGIIRTTLKEYGFKVPEVNPTVNRKIKKRRKPYKLLLTTKEQKQQIISDRYTQLLFEFNNSKRTSTSTDLDYSTVFYNMATNIEYDKIRDDDVFYVDDLIEKSPNNMGCLLKDWSNIPGRPTSPTQDKSDVIFSEIECSQDEVDIVLSGPLKFSKDIIKRKYLYKRKSSVCIIDEEVIDKTHEEIDPVIVACDDRISSPEVVTAIGGCINERVNKDNPIEVIAVQEKQLLTVTQPGRSLSPDLFDDDDDDTVVEVAEESPVKVVSNVTKVTSAVMDLTECVNVISQENIKSYYRNVKQFSQLSQDADVTKRKSNDFMEITECVGVTSQPIQETKEEHIDLTIACNNYEVVEKKSNYVENIDNIEHMDLTQSSNSSNESLPFVHISGKERLPEKSLDDTIILNDIDYQEVNTLKLNTNVHPNTDELKPDNDEYESITTEFKQSSDEVTKKNSPEKLIQVLPKEASIINLDETSEIEKVEDNIDLTQNSKSNDSEIGSPLKDTTQCINNSKTSEVDKAEDNIDLTQTSKSNESDIHSHKDTALCINNSRTCEVNKAENDVHLNQTSKLNEWEIESPTKDTTQFINNSSLGKKDDISVDYDEALENMNCYVDYADDSNFNDENNTELDYNVASSNQAVTVNNSKHAEVVELDESESNSPHKDAGQNFDIGGISVINELQSFNRESRNTLNMPNGSVMSESLPMVDIKGTEPPSKQKTPFEEFLDPILDNINDRNVINNEPSSTTKTPSKEANVKMAVTPKQSEYIVKTDNVTPMVDYAAMTSPERNRELDKYGLKPFKRKRAIQLLTHLYNQTHPFVESTQELTSPSKRRKLSLSLSQPSTSTSKSPRKLLNSPKKASKPRNTSKTPRKGSEDSGSLNGSDKENYMFMETSEAPALRDIDCGPDDWVFQKREKAKLHTCRVPLHIAFHNFVSCRRLLHEAILRYEPVNIDVVHKEMAASGHRYDPKDLLKFMDKKCITVKTADNAKNKNRY